MGVGDLVLLRGAQGLLHEGARLQGVDLRQDNQDHQDLLGLRVRQVLRVGRDQVRVRVGAFEGTLNQLKHWNNNR